MSERIRIDPCRVIISDDLVAALEDQIGVTFPPDYREFLLTYNAGRPEPNVFPLSKIVRGIGVVNVVDFFGLCVENYADIMWVRNVLSGRLPEWLFPIAADGCGNVFCLSTREVDKGAVYFWDHELEVFEDDPKESESIFRLASSFSEFIAGLQKVS